MYKLRFRKKYLLSRDDLQIDWKPLDKFFNEVQDEMKNGMFKYPANLESDLVSVISSCRTWVHMTIINPWLISVTYHKIDWFFVWDCSKIQYLSVKVVYLLWSKLFFISRYFPASDTLEILNKYKPALCPLDNAEMQFTIQTLDNLLPTCVKAEEIPISTDLWFQEFMSLWNSCRNDNSWEQVINQSIAYDIH